MRIATLALLLFAPALPAQTLVLENGTVIEGNGNRPRANTTVVVRNGKITDLYAAGQRAAPQGAVVLDVAGKFVMPGLIDAHVHLATDPSYSDSRPRVEGRLRQALHGGVTSVRDMAGDARMLADLARAADNGEIESPAIYYAALFAGKEFFADRRTIAMSRGLAPGSVPWGLAVSDTTDLSLAVARAKGTGATGIKLYAALSDTLVERIAREAHRQGMRVWSHARVGLASAAHIVAGGADAVSHADMFVCVLDPCRRAPDAAVYEAARVDAPSFTRLLEDMKRRSVVLDPTLYVYDVIANRSAARAKFAAAVTAEAHRRGVELSAGTDSIGSGDIAEYPNVHHELELLVHNAGLTPLAAIRAGTLGGAKAIGIDKTHGSIEIGKVADLIVLDRDPSADIGNTRSVRHVIRNGRLFTRKPQ